MREMTDGIEQYSLISPSKVSLQSFGQTRWITVVRCPLDHESRRRNRFHFVELALQGIVPGIPSLPFAPTSTISVACREGPSWVGEALVTRNAYRSRWREGEAWDTRYDPLQRKLHEVEAISTSTLMIQGTSDDCDPPGLSEGLERHFRGRYERVLLDAVGHFPHREAPAAVATAILRHLRSRD